MRKVTLQPAEPKHSLLSVFTPILKSLFLAEKGSSLGSSVGSEVGSMLLNGVGAVAVCVIVTAAAGAATAVRFLPSAAPTITPPARIPTAVAATRAAQPKCFGLVRDARPGGVCAGPVCPMASVELAGSSCGPSSG
jgi:hypothetical protein